MKGQNLSWVWQRYWQDKSVLDLNNMAVFESTETHTAGAWFRFLFHKVTKVIVTPPWIECYGIVGYPSPPPRIFARLSWTRIYPQWRFCQRKRLISSLEKLSIKTAPDGHIFSSLIARLFFSFRLKYLWCILLLGCLATLRRRSVFME